MKKYSKVFTLVLALLMVMVSVVMNPTNVFATSNEGGEGPDYSYHYKDWVELDDEHYRIMFGSPDYAYNYMNYEDVEPGEDFTLPANRYVKPGYNFDHWEEVDGALYGEIGGSRSLGATYQNKDTIPAGTYEAGQIVYLAARYTPRDTSVNIQDGEFEFTIRGGETAIFENIPGGTAYQVWEYTPDGWILVDYNRNSGIISPLRDSNAWFLNKYEPETVGIYLHGIKMIGGQPASNNEFEFVAYCDGREVGYAYTRDGGSIQFDPMFFTEPGEFVVEIREVLPDFMDNIEPYYPYDNPDDPSDPGEPIYPDIDMMSPILYDTHTEIVTIRITENEEGLHGEVEYDDDGMYFQNDYKPGDLQIIKYVPEELVTDANKDDEFEFEVILRYTNGQPIDEDLYWYSKPGIPDQLIPNVDPWEDSPWGPDYPIYEE